MFFGLESLRYFAAQINVARNTRRVVQGIPLVPALGSRSRSRSRYTSVDSSVGTCTFDSETRTEMNVSRDGRVGLVDEEASAFAKSGLVGVWGGVRIECASL